MKLGHAQVELEYVEQLKQFRGVVVRASELRPGDQVEFFGRSPEELRYECLRSLAAYRNSLNHWGLAEPDL